MLTRDQALTERYFHDDKCRMWRRNGQTKTWKTRPDEYRVPVKYGLHTYDTITQTDATIMHIPGEDCQKN